MIKPLVKDVLSKYRDMPIEFCQDFLDAKLIWSGQKKILESVRDNKRTTVPSGHSTGKSASASLITIWWLSTRYNSRVLVTAPTYRQLQSVYYAEVNKWYNKSLLKKFEMFRLKQNVMTINDEELKKEWYMLPISPKTADALQGQHGDKSEDVNRIMQDLGIQQIESDDDLQQVIEQMKTGNSKESNDNLLVIIDEASGVSKEILEVLEGTDYSRLVLFGNMTKNTGMFYDSVYRSKGEFNVIRLSSRNSPFMVNEQIEYIEKRYGKESNVVRVRIDGLPPDSEHDTIISRDLAERCINKTINESEIEEKYKLDKDIIDIGVDVARFGDDNTQIYIREGYYITNTSTANGQDTVETANRVLRICNENSGKKIRVRVDGVGVGGGVIDILNNSYTENVEVIEIHNNGKALDQKEYANWITEGFFELKEYMENGIVCLPNDDELIEDLCGRKYGFDSSGRLLLESKDKFKERFGRSPDKGDAFIQCWKKTNGFWVF